MRTSRVQGRYDFSVHSEGPDMEEPQISVKSRFTLTTMWLMKAVMIVLTFMESVHHGEGQTTSKCEYIICKCHVYIHVLN